MKTRVRTYSKEKQNNKTSKADTNFFYFLSIILSGGAIYVYFIFGLYTTIVTVFLAIILILSIHTIPSKEKEGEHYDSFLKVKRDQFFSKNLRFKKSKKAYKGAVSFGNRNLLNHHNYNSNKNIKTAFQKQLLSQYIKNIFGLFTLFLICLFLLLVYSGNLSIFYLILWSVILGFFGSFSSYNGIGKKQYLLGDKNKIISLSQNPKKYIWVNNTVYFY